MKPNPEPQRGRPPLPDGEAATHHIHLRVEARRKAAYVKAAKPRGLSEWMIEQLDRAAGFDTQQ